MTDTVSESGPIVYPSDEVMKCPYENYARMREYARVYKVPGRNQYVISHRDDVMDVLRKPEIFSNRSFVIEDGRMREATLDDVHDTERVATFQSSDPPAHTVKRKLAFEYFKPGRLKGFDPVIEASADELIDGFAGDGHVDFVAQYAQQLSGLAALKFVGLPIEDLDSAIKWAEYEGQGSRYHTEERQLAIADRVRSMYEYIDPQIRKRYAEGSDDILAQFVQSHIDTFGEEKGTENAVVDSISLLLGAVSTTAHMLGNTMFHILEHPEQVDAANDPKSIVRAIEESLRIDAPVQWNGRLVTEDTEVAGMPIPAGALVILGYASANYDEEHWGEGGDVFDVSRRNVRDHMAFGYGVHSCIGAPLARQIGRIGLERFFARLQNVRLAPENTFEQIDTNTFRGLRELLVVFDAAATT